MDKSNDSKASDNFYLSKPSCNYQPVKRFENEFENLGVIGKGGFSTVYKVKHKLDQALYAVKVLKIMNKKRKKQSKVDSLHSKLDKVLNEVRFLANLKNENLVTYYGSWVEVECYDDKRLSDSLREIKSKDKSRSKKTNQDIECSELSIEEQVDDTNESMNSFIEFRQKEISDEYCDLKPNNQYKLNEIKSANSQNDFSNRSPSLIIINNIPYELRTIKCLKIFIQTELCDNNLSDYLSEMNSKISIEKEINSGSKQDISSIINERLQIFSNITNALITLHDNGLIHRDIKPSNVFLKDNKVKLGDLGLATTISLIKNINSQNESDGTLLDLVKKSSSYESNHQFTQVTHISKKTYSRKFTYTSPKSKIDEKPKSRSNLKKTQSQTKSDKSQKEIRILTKNIGTIQYAAPEQLNTENYNQKVDIFSLGLVLFELVHSTKTLMEKTEKMKNIKTLLKFPLVFDMNSLLIRVKELISNMVVSDPSKRYDIYQVKYYLDENFNDLSLVKNSLSHPAVKSKDQCSCNETHKKSTMISEVNKFPFTTSMTKETFSFDKEIFKHRSRFASEQVNSKPFEVLMRNFEQGHLKDKWKKIWAKLVDGKLLLFNKRNSNKANLMYDLRECIIKGNYFEDEEKKENTHLFLSDSRNHNKQIPKNIINTSLIRKKVPKGLIVSAYDDQSRNLIRHPSLNNLHLNYEVEVNHPYLQKCVLKSEEIMESYEMYKCLSSLSEVA